MISDILFLLAPATAAAPTQQASAPALPPPPQYYAPPVVYQPQPPVPVGPSLKSIALIVVLGVGAASILIQLFKKYIWSYWFPRKNLLSEKIELMETKITAAHELVTAQAAETKEAMSVLRAYLDSQITDWQERQRLELLKTNDDEKALSDLKREVSSVRHLIPSVSSLSRSAKASVLQSDVLEEIKNELASLKNAVKGIVSNASSSTNLLRSSTAPIASVPSTPTNTPAEQSSEIASPAPSTPAITSSQPAASSTAPANPLTSSKRALPSWMQSQKSLPSWQMQDKPADTTSPSPSPEPTAEPSPAAGVESKSSDEASGTE